MNRKYLVKLFKEKVEKEKSIPTAKDIDKDKNFPSYRKFKKVFGGKRIREAKELRRIIDQYKINFKINELFCKDCKFNKLNCGNKLEDCKSKGKLYIRFLKQELESH